MVLVLVVKAEEFNLCQLKGAQKCSPTCTNQYFRTKDMDDTSTPTCSDISVDKYSRCNNQFPCDILIDACIGAYSTKNNTKCTWNDYTNKCIDCFN